MRELIDGKGKCREVNSTQVFSENPAGCRNPTRIGICHGLEYHDRDPLPPYLWS